MHFTMLTDRRSVVTFTAMLVVFSLPLVAFDAADPYQPIRALIAAVALASLAVSGGPRTGRVVAVTVALSAALIVWLAISAGENGWASAVFGVHGRFQGLVSALVCLLALGAGLSVRSADVRRAGPIAAGCGAAIAALVIGQALSGSDPAGWTNTRVVVAGWLAVVMSIAAAAASVTGARVRWALLGAVVPGAVAVGLTGTRGAWFAMFAGVLTAASALFAGSTDRRRRAGAVVLVAGVTAVTALAAFAGGGEAAGKLDPAALTGGSAASRWQIWRGAVAMVRDEPWTGHGPGRFIYEFPRYQPFEHARVEATDTRPDQAHSLPLQLAAEGGVPAAMLGASVFGLALYAGISGMRRRDAAALVATAGLAAYGVQSLFGVAAVELDVLGWFVAGIAVARSAGAVEAAARTRAVYSVASSAVAAAVVLACTVYLAGDVRYRRALEAFDGGDMAEARVEAAAAVRVMPLVDVYRVAFADGALYEAQSEVRAAALAEARSLLDRGLAHEPSSYDLALASARVLAASGGAPDSVARAYLDACRRYPLGVEVRTAAVGALRRAGRHAEADRMQGEIDRLLASRSDR